MNVKLTPHSEQLLREQLSRGLYHTPEEVIERALESLGENDRVSMPTGRRHTRKEFRAWLDAFAAYSDKIPSMPGETFSREMIYQDHD